MELLETTLLPIIRPFLYGIGDSFKGFKVAYYLDREISERNARMAAVAADQTASSSPVRRRITATKKPTPPPTEKLASKRILQCSVLNGAIFLASLVLFRQIILPCIHALLTGIFGDTFLDKWWLIESLLSLLFQATWVVPLFVISRLVNLFWFQDIANLAFKYSSSSSGSTRRRGQSSIHASAGLPNTTLSQNAADLIFSLVIQTLFLVQAVLISYLPIYALNNLLSAVHLSLLYALYAFDYKWGTMGWELHKRLGFIETNLLYFIGFGLPLVVATQFISTDCAFSGCVFAVLFPFFIISGHVAAPSTNTGANTSGKVVFHIFTPVVAVSNALFKITIPKKKT